MKSYKLVHQLLDLVEQFENENSNNELSLADFSGFLLNSIQHSGNEVSPDIRFGEFEHEAQELAYQIDNNIGKLVIYMSRYAKSYIKKALEGSLLQTAEDFTCLAILLTHDNLSKGDLISRNIQEKTSGTEVIRRLLVSGLVEQWDDPDDKRGKRIAITAKGKALLYDIFADMNHVGKMVTGNLSFSEKLTLQYLLQKLENFHYNVYENKAVSTKEELRSFDKEAVSY